MKFLAAIITAVVLFFGLLTEKKDITVTVPNVSSNKGKVSFALYQKDGFLTTPIQATSATIEDGKSVVTFKNVAPGEYAITCYHDANNNNKMDFGPGGMPQESYGATNNVMSFGPPQYDHAKFTIADKDVSLEIKL